MKSMSSLLLALPKSIAIYPATMAYFMPSVSSVSANLNATMSSGASVGLEMCIVFLCLLNTMICLSLDVFLLSFVKTGVIGIASFFVFL